MDNNDYIYDEYGYYDEYGEYHEYEVEDDVQEEDVSLEVESIIRDKNRRQAIGEELLSRLDEEECDNFSILLSMYKDYYVDWPDVMMYASERLTDVYYVGEVYLQPLFQNDNERLKYILKRIEQWDKTADVNKFKYKELRILTDIYQVPTSCARMLLKYVCSKDKFCKPSLRERIKKIITKLK